MPFTLTRRPNELVFRPVRLTARTWLAPHYVRVRLEGDALRGFDSPGSDDHLRVFFPDGASVPDLVDTDALREFPSREYTPLAWDASGGSLDLEFVVHGHGVAGRWAAEAAVGSLVGVGGPRGSMVVDGSPAGWFLAGDETALPAIRRFLEQLSRVAPDGRGLVLVEVPDADHRPPIEAPAGTELRWVHRGEASEGSALAAALDALGAADRPAPAADAGDVFAFIAAEHSIVKPGRALVLDRWALDAERVIVKGYWRRGEAEYHAPH
ncbi:siderophore-interacting protein [Agromyces silvae]|uniref:siderophore-interacting protein n=1 Tax=Agromyces silvae TaxID=3388266 RepID=UPI00280A72FC|nr:siderophore-interacting protein [Agromyces protaetiae]